MINVHVKTMGDLEKVFIALGKQADDLGLIVPKETGDVERGLTWFFRTRGSYQDNPFKLLAEELERQITPTMFCEKMVIQSLEYYKGMWDLMNSS